MVNEVVVVPTDDHQDARIAADVVEALRRNRHAPPSRLDVAVANGEVTLSGEVDDPEVHRQVLDAARDTSGVTGIVDNLQVRRPGATTDSAPPINRGCPNPKVPREDRRALT